MYTKLIQAIEKQGKLILDTERYIWRNPETEFREWKASKYLADIFEGLGYKLTMAGDIPGFYTDIDTGKPGPKVLILGEMDSLINSLRETFKEADLIRFHPIITKGGAAVNAIPSDVTL